MRLAQIVALAAQTWNDYLKRISQLSEAGLIAIPAGCVLLYPRLLLVTEMPGWFAVELIGGGRSFPGKLRVKKHRAISVNAYMGQNEAVPAPAESRFVINGSENSFRFLLLMREGAAVEMERRFPHVASTFPTSVAGTGDLGSGALIELREGDFFRLEDCLLVHSWTPAVRIRSFNCALFIRRSNSEHSYVQYMKRMLDEPELHGLMTVESGHAEHLAIASNFASLYLMGGMRETTIGEFINRHEMVLKAALGAKTLIYEPLLPWRHDARGSREPAINPDCILVHADGSFDICDLKLPLLNRTSLTKGNRNRRRFVDSVEEGIAQLAHYKEYFADEVNAAKAAELYGIRSTSSPRMVLIVGNEENFEASRVKEASRRLQPFELLSYDTVLQLYLASSGYSIVSRPN